MTLYLLLVLIGAAGLSLSLYINRKKRKRKKMVCPVGADCDTVIRSDYSKFFGIPVELIGAIYYGLIVIYYGAALIFGSFVSIPLTFVIFSATLAAFLFSAYLTFIQGFVINNWCSWCLLSASFCTVIFILAVASLPQGLIPFLQSSFNIIAAFYLLSVALGVGGATVSTVLFIRFLRDFRISHMESKVLQVVADIVWGAIILLVISSMGIHLPDLIDNTVSGELFVKSFVIGIILVNAIILHFFVSPRLKRISYGEKHAHEKGELKEIHRVTFGLGAVSLVSWYFMFFISIVRTLPLNVLTTLGVYLGLLTMGIIMSQFAEFYFRNKKEVFKKEKEV